MDKLKLFINRLNCIEWLIIFKIYKIKKEYCLKKKGNIVVMYNILLM